jgi:hypothetical protein
LAKQGAYTYTILGTKKETGYPIFLHEQRISYFEKSRIALSQSVVYFSPGFEKSTRLEIVIFNAYTEAIIKIASLDFDPKKNKNIGVRVTEMAEEGVKNFVVNVKDNKTKETKKFYFRLSEEGAFTPYSKGQ